MKLLKEISISSAAQERKIQLYNGDLTNLEPSESVDLLVISAFPGDYTPTPNSLIGALSQKGLSVVALAKNKDEDMREELGCWFSKELSKDLQERLNIKRLLCFEPLTKSSSAPEVVSNIFRCINNFIFNEALNHIALPIVATGNQRFPLKEMCEALLDASIFWLERGLPVNSIKLVHKNPETVNILKDVFDRKAATRGAFDFKGESINAQANDKLTDRDEDLFAPQSRGSIVEKKFGAPASAPAPVMPPDFISTNTTYDVFISYSHKQKKAADKLVQELRNTKPGIKIFYDDSSIPKGMQWLRLISEAIDASKKVVIIISPEYTDSRICWDEFQCAKVREYNSDVNLLVTIYLKTHEKLPSIFQLNNWIDCREEDEEKIKAACREVLNALA